MTYFHFSLVSVLFVLWGRFYACDGRIGNETILVVGAAGFVGSYATASLVSSGLNVIAIDAFSVESNLMKRYRSWRLLMEMNVNIERLNICVIDMKSFFYEKDVKHVVFLGNESQHGNDPCIEKVFHFWNANVAASAIAYNPMFVYMTQQSMTNLAFASDADGEGGMVVRIVVDVTFGPLDDDAPVQGVTKPFRKSADPTLVIEVANTILLILQHSREYVKNTNIRSIQVNLVSSAIAEPTQQITKSILDQHEEKDVSFLQKERNKQQIMDMHLTLLRAFTRTDEVRTKRRVGVIVRLNLSSEVGTLSGQQRFNNLPVLRMPCASECGTASTDCIVTGYDAVIPTTKALTKECEVVLYTIGIHRNQSSLKMIQAKNKLLTSCSLAFIHKMSPLSQSAGRVYQGWTLVRVHGIESFQSARKASRLPKLNPARFFAPNVQHAVYFDSSSSPTLDPGDVAAQMLSKDKSKRAGVLMFHHPTLMYYGPSSVRSAMEEAELAKSRSSMVGLLELQKMAYEKATEKVLQGTKNTIMPTALFIIWDLHSRAAHDFRCEWYSEYLLWADRDQVALFFILAKASHAQNSTNAAFDEWIPLSKPPRSMYLRLLLGKNEKYPFFIKGEDDEKGYPVSSLHTG